jgi:hypothetical protein
MSDDSFDQYYIDKALHCAVDKKDPALVQAIIGDGAINNTRNLNKALLRAAEKGDVPTMKALLKSGADPHAYKNMTSQGRHYWYDGYWFELRNAHNAHLKSGVMVNAERSENREAIRFAKEIEKMPPPPRVETRPVPIHMRKQYQKHLDRLPFI